MNKKILIAGILIGLGFGLAIGQSFAYTKGLDYCINKGLELMQTLDLNSLRNILDKLIQIK